MRFYATDREQMEQQRQQRLRHQLEIQSVQIETVFERHKVPTRVAGGQVGPGWVRFELHTQLAAAMERIQQIKADLLRALMTEEIQIDANEDRLQLQVAQPAVEPVNLLDLLAVVPPLPPLTAALGWSEDDRPVMVELASADAPHLLLVGSEQAGKTVLLRSMALSLALHNRPSRLQLVVIDGGMIANPTHGAELKPLDYLPHMLTPIVTDKEGAQTVLQFLGNEITYRMEQGITTPAIAVMIDGGDFLFAGQEKGEQEALRKLVREGAAAGIHVLLAVRDVGVLDNLFKAHFPARIVGKVPSNAAAWSATGIRDSQADYSIGQGDFIALAGGEMTHFQAAYIGGLDLLQTIEPLYQRQLPVLLAQPTTIRPTLQPDPPPPSSPLSPSMPEVRTFVSTEDDEISFLDDIE